MASTAGWRKVIDSTRGASRIREVAAASAAKRAVASWKSVRSSAVSAWDMKWSAA
ncbi:Uncharacterised protein [Mycobacteroides abscessus subsp. abscessus]|nr:Uncharacterised protein [Mycobacteroides abscessus subsp. abscessus]